MERLFPNARSPGSHPAGGYSLISLFNNRRYNCYTSVIFRFGRNRNPARRFTIFQGRQFSSEFVLPAFTAQGGVHGGDGRLPGDVRAVHLRGSAVVIVGEAAPVAGGQGSVKVLSRYAAYMDGAASGTTDVTRGIAGNDGAVCVGSHHATGPGVACTVIFNGHVARGIAGGQGGTGIRCTCHAACPLRSLHCGRGTASGDGTALLIAHHTAYVATADAARHRAVFNVAAKAPSRHAADERATCYVYFCQHHVLHRAFDEAEQTRISVTSRNGQPRDGLAIAVEGAGV